MRLAAIGRNAVTMGEEYCAGSKRGQCSDPVALTLLAQTGHRFRMKVLRARLWPRIRHGSLSIVTLLVLSTVAIADDAGPRAHPAEAGLSLFLAPLEYRQVVRNEDGGYDIWMHGGAKWGKVRGRLEAASKVGFEMPGGWRIQKAVWLDADRSFWLDLSGPGELRVRATRDGEGALFELRDAGLKEDAPPWAPPFTPLPLNLVHGPIR